MGGVKVADEDYVYDLKRSVEGERERERESGDGVRMKMSSVKK